LTINKEYRISSYFLPKFFPCAVSIFHTEAYITKHFYNVNPLLISGLRWIYQLY